MQLAYCAQVGTRNGRGGGEKYARDLRMGSVQFSIILIFFYPFTLAMMSMVSLVRKSTIFKGCLRHLALVGNSPTLQKPISATFEQGHLGG